jgi:Fur family transcriptional regulator, peroxide stress response regulator
VDKIRYSRMTNQRLRILEYLQETKEHPTAEALYQTVRKELPKISKGTIYRNLKILEREGSVKKLEINDGQTHWDGNPNPHHHFVCKRCGRIIEINLADNWQIEERIEGKYGVKVDQSQLLVRGLCDFCLKH